MAEKRKSDPFGSGAAFEAVANEGRMFFGGDEKPVKKAVKKPAARKKANK